MKILHTADLHLKDFEDERWKALKKILKVGHKQHIDALIISGDLFDRDINAEILRPKIREVFDKCSFKVIIIPGNHDIKSFASGKYFGENIEIIDDFNISLRFGDITIWGIPYMKATKEEVLDILQSLKSRMDEHKTNILLYHGELLDIFFHTGDAGFEGEERYMPVKLSYFRDLMVDYVLAGHFHTNFNVLKLPESGYFIYPGSPVSITKRETGNRYVNIFTTCNPPEKFKLMTSYYEELNIILNPYENIEPYSGVIEKIEKIPDEAKILLTIDGYTDSDKIGINESELIKKIKKYAGSRCTSIKFNFRDISKILQDDLFIEFRERLENLDYYEEKKRKITELAINAMMKSLL